MLLPENTLLEESYLLSFDLLCIYYSVFPLLLPLSYFPGHISSTIRCHEVGIQQDSQDVIFTHVNVFISSGLTAGPPKQPLDI